MMSKFQENDFVILMLSNLSIILLLYSPRFPSNITFQGAAAKLLHFSRVVSQVLALFFFFFFLLFDVHISKLY